MKGALLAVFLVSTTPVYPQSNQPDAMMARWKKAQTYASEGFQPVSYVAGQVTVEGKALQQQPFSVFMPDESRKCCGEPLKTARTDQHGHFLVEPLSEGRYFAKFQSDSSKDDLIVSFAVVESYKRCDGTHLEINFLKTGKATVQDHVDINDSGTDCKASEPQCYRK
jgi:hypothetical protein